MENYVEWSDRKRLIDLKNRYCTLYQNDDGSMFYIEPAFYTSLMRFKELRNKEYSTILAEMDGIVRKNRLVVFTADSDDALTIADHAIFLTITDVTNRLKIFIEDKSRGSDYGD